MADAWDIGCTTLMKHKIVTVGGPVLIKPRRQPMNLESKIDEAITNLWDNNIIKNVTHSGIHLQFAFGKKIKNILDYVQILGSSTK